MSFSSNSFSIKWTDFQIWQLIFSKGDSGSATVRNLKIDSLNNDKPNELHKDFIVYDRLLTYQHTIFVGGITDGRWKFPFFDSIS